MSFIPTTSTCPEFYPSALTHWGRDEIDAILHKCIFLNEIVSILIEISLKFILKSPFNNIPADQATSHYLNQW